MPRITPVVYVVEREYEARGFLVSQVAALGHTTKGLHSMQAVVAASPTGGCVVLNTRTRRPVNTLANLPGLADCRLPILLLVNQVAVPQGLRSLRQGVIHFVSKPICNESLRFGLEFTLGQRAAPYTEPVPDDEVRRRLRQLSPREYEVLELVLEGYSSTEIARQFRRSEKTVMAHRAKIMRKMQAADIGQLAHMCSVPGPDEPLIANRTVPATS